MQGRTSGLVFTRDDGSPWDPDTATKTWAKVLAEAGMPDNVVLHGARHGAIEIMNAAGVSWDDIKDIVGHSTVKMSLDYRSKPDQARLGSAMESMSRMLEQ
jgi:integrase